MSSIVFNLRIKMDKRPKTTAYDMKIRLKSHSKSPLASPFHPFAAISIVIEINHFLETISVKENRIVEGFNA